MPEFFEVKDVPELGIVRLRRLTSPRDSVSNVVYIDESKLTGAGVTQVKTMPLAEKVAWPSGVEDGSIYEVEYKVGVPGSKAKSITARADLATINGGESVDFTHMFDGTNISATDFDFVVDPVTTKKGGVVDANGTLTVDDNADGAIKVTATAKTAAGTVHGSPATFNITKVTPATYPAMTLTQNLNATESVKVGDRITLSVAADGGKPPYKYTWTKGSTVVGTDSPTFTIPTAAAGDAGNYRVTVQDSQVPRAHVSSVLCAVDVS